MYTSIHELLGSWNQEAALTQAVMGALTDASLQQPVSEGGRTLGRIAWHIVTSTPGMLHEFGLKVEQEAGAEPTSARAIADGWRRVSTAAAQAVEQQWSDAALTEQLNVFGQQLTKAGMIMLLIHHHIHHRGQMTVLMRQAGLVVPGVYGPAKEGWAQMGVPEAPL